MVKNIFCRSVFHNFTCVHYGNSVCNICHNTKIVCNKNYAHIPLALEFFYKFKNLSLNCYVKCSCRFIAYKHFGVCGNGNGNYNTLPHSARKFKRILAESFFGFRNSHFFHYGNCAKISLLCCNFVHRLNRVPQQTALPFLAKNFLNARRNFFAYKKIRQRIYIAKVKFFFRTGAKQARKLSASGADLFFKQSKLFQKFRRVFQSFALFFNRSQTRTHSFQSAAPVGSSVKNCGFCKLRPYFDNRIK